jgi:hypothetical protein
VPERPTQSNPPPRPAGPLPDRPARGGIAAFAALAAQRAHIQRVRAATAEVDAEVAESGSILKRMHRWWRVGL